MWELGLEWGGSITHVDSLIQYVSSRDILSLWIASLSWANGGKPRLFQSISENRDGWGLCRESHHPLLWTYLSTEPAA